jgi:hypothetical protein
MLMLIIGKKTNFTIGFFLDSLLPFSFYFGLPEEIIKCCMDDTQ